MPKLMTETELNVIRAEFEEDFRSDIGCWIDGSHQSIQDANWAIIHVAIDSGWKVFLDELVSASQGREWDSEVEDEDMLRWLAEEALDYLNAIVPDGLYFHWDNSDLFLSDSEDDDNE